ncbi:sugar ABC transporter permease [Microlunatus elymi]|uniref:Sugar ABC transporter permease n=2 Tax=Microlunatus elymi TaxID=2596828 RepID=A0A516Q5N8_9ACTN|nr:sugar ABC transporter permease [Microlunatus elymi]
MLIPPIAYAVVFLYWPLYGLQIAFRNYNIVDGITGSPWVGLQYLQQFVTSYQFWPVLKNTLILNIYELFALFPLPVILALLLNSVRNAAYRRGVQLITYAPHFISTVVLVGMMVMLFSPNGGIVNQGIGLLGHSSVDFFASPTIFRNMYVWSGAWQTLGWSAIIYLAALAGVDPQLHEAAKMDGANILRRIWHIDFPAVIPVTITLLILNMGSMLSSGFEKVLLMQTPLNLSASEVLDTYTYRVGLASTVPQFSYATAIGLFRSVFALILLLLANWLARRVSRSNSLF